MLKMWRGGGVVNGLYNSVKRKKLSNKAPSSLHLLSKCSFTPSKLRFFELRAPKISSCYTTSQEKVTAH